VEVLGFVVLPCGLFVSAVRSMSVRTVQVAAVLTMIGIVLNRINVTIIGFKWDAPMHYYPSWMEVVITLAIIFIEIWVFRWIVHRMAVLRSVPDWAVDTNRRRRLIDNPPGSSPAV
jgi:Ni/Fe-hydrogenase subunit HybB-like protein